MRARLVALLALSIVALPTPGQAQQGTAGWFVGVAAGRLDTRFQPGYFDLVDGERSQFTNEANGIEVQLLAGRYFGGGDRVSFALQGSVALNDFDWNLFLAEEPAEFSYALPWAAVVSAIPQLRLGERLAATAELGGGVGRVHMIKVSPVTSSYDHDHPTALLAVGAGLALQMSSRVDLLARYRHLRYASGEFDSFGPSGAVVENVTDEPRANSFSIGLTARF